MKKILPTILAVITQHNRHKVENLEWSNKSITYNLFRLWELVFWRRCGKSNNSGDTIRIESRTTAIKIDGEVIVTHRFYTWESLIVHAEEIIRKFFTLPELGFRFVRVPQLVTPNGQVFPLNEIFSFAIAFDVASSINETNSTVTLAHTSTGSDRILFTSIGLFSSATITTLKYADVNMVAVKGPQANGTENYYLRYLFAPASGANNQVLVSSASVNTAIEQSTYSGAHQTNSTEITGGAVETNSASPYTATVTTVADNCWLVGRARTSAAATVASTGTTQRASQFSSYGDSDGAKTPAGAYSMAWTTTAGTIFGQVCSFAPSVDTSGKNSNFMLMGVGQ